MTLGIAVRQFYTAFIIVRSDLFPYITIQISFEHIQPLERDIDHGNLELPEPVLLRQRQHGDSLTDAAFTDKQDVPAVFTFPAVGNHVPYCPCVFCFLCSISPIA